MSLMLNSNSDDGETLYSDSVFSTYLYTGNASTQTITNGIDLAGKGGMVWLKSRSTTYNNYLQDTTRGIQNSLVSNDTSAQSVGNDIVDSVSASGFAVSLNNGGNNSGSTYVSWTFRKAAKFFDVVTYTGTGSARTIAHSLGVAPGMIIVKRTDTTADWQVYHRSLTSAAYSIQLNLRDAQASVPTVWNSTAPTSSVFSVGTDATVNASGGTYVAYLFAHDTSSTGIIQCGSFTSTYLQYPNITLGWEPQYILIRRTDIAENWAVMDVMRPAFNAIAASGNDVTQVLAPNTSGFETGTSYYLGPNATGFSGVSNFTPSTTATYIYMAIRRPNKPPTSGTQVYNAIARTGNATITTITGIGFSPDVVRGQRRDAAGWHPVWCDKLRGPNSYLRNDNTEAERSDTSAIQSFEMDGIKLGSDGNSSQSFNGSGYTYIQHHLKRAPGFFDEVCYTGNGATQNINHNLTSSPELLIFADRTSSGANFTTWQVACSQLGLSAKGAWLYFTNAFSTSYANIITAATSTTFSLDSSYGSYTPNVSTHTYVAYLFATLAGISKVGSYTGNGSSQNIECGFAAGARFVLVKATSTTGDWLVADTARGIVSGNDPILSLNSSAAEVTGEDWLDPYAPGFTVNQTTASANASGVSYIFLAIS